MIINCAFKKRINSFTILRKCNSEYEAKIYKALLVKCHGLVLINNAMQVERHFG